ncbi:hypothetical protein BGZ73_000838 [Actinomortierella ambigua]|nr:hypothetical protein BGZ73_000838 [Actinomortierella ambigua]
MADIQKLMCNLDDAAWKNVPSKQPNPNWSKQDIEKLDGATALSCLKFLKDQGDQTQDSGDSSMLSSAWKRNRRAIEEAARRAAEESAKAALVAALI